MQQMWIKCQANNRMQFMRKIIMCSLWMISTRYDVIFTRVKWPEKKNKSIIALVLTRSIAFLLLKFIHLMSSFISKYSFNPGAKFLILFINPNVHGTASVQGELAFKLFRLMYDRYNAANVMLLYAIDDTQYNIYVTNPYRNSTHCGK